MGRKKQINGSTISIDLPPIPAPEPVDVPDQPKKKRELSDKQRENLSKGMAILKAKRESKSKKDDVEEEPAPAPPPPPPPPQPAPVPVAPIESISRYAPSEKKERKPRIVKNYLTTEDFNSFKTELLTSLKPSSHQQPVIPSIREPVMPSIKEPAMRERVISGKELLDAIFFKKY